ncbi:MAG: hypothetical protein JNN09_08360 [Alphaproteobacteria bacterium]|nr:hypothetical protein [Alphaproteobacteria bacterium]
MSDNGIDGIIGKKPTFIQGTGGVLRAHFALESTGQTHTMSEQDLQRAIDKDPLSDAAESYEKILMALRTEKRNLELAA